MSRLLKHNYQNLVCLNEALKSFEDLLFQNNFPSEGLEMLFTYPELPEILSWSFDYAIYQLHKKRAECLTALITVKGFT